MTPRLYTTAEVCAILGVTRTTINTIVNAGVLESPLRGKISIRSLEAFLEDGRSWQVIADEKRRAAKKAQARNGKTKRPGIGAGASPSKGKVTPLRMLTGRGRKGNLLT